MNFRQLLELAKKTGKKLSEIFVNIPGSYSTYRKEIRSLLNSNPPAILGAHKYAYVEEILGDTPDSVIIEAYKSGDNGGEYTYFQVPISINEQGNLAWGEGKEVKFDVGISAKNESQTLQDNFGNTQPQMVPLI